MTYMITFIDWGQDLTHLYVHFGDDDEHMGIITAVSGFCSSVVVGIYKDKGVNKFSLSVGNNFEYYDTNESGLPCIRVTKWIIESIEEVAEKGGEA